MTANMVNNKKIIPVPHEIEYLEAGDCIMVLFSHLLRYYGVDYMPAEMMVATASLDFMLNKYEVGEHICFFVSGRKFDMEESFAGKLGLKLEQRYYVLGEDEARTKTECLKEMIGVLKQGYPLFVTIDRFYLDYLRIQRSHMPYHALIIIGYDEKKEVFTAIDSLADTYVQIPAEIIMKSMFETSVMKREAKTKWYFIDAEKVRDLHKPDIKDGMLKQIGEYTENGGALDRINDTIRFLEMILKKCKGTENKNYYNFIKYQVTMLYTEIHDQDYEHLFYRKLYFGQCMRYIEDFGAAEEKKEELFIHINEAVALWGKLSDARAFGQKFEMKQVSELIDSLKCIYMAEKRIFEAMKTMLL